MPLFLHPLVQSAVYVVFLIVVICYCQIGVTFVLKGCHINRSMGGYEVTLVRSWQFSSLWGVKWFLQCSPSTCLGGVKGGEGGGDSKVSLYARYTSSLVVLLGISISSTSSQNWSFIPTVNITLYIKERCFFVFSTSEFPRGIEPQTFGFRVPMLYHWATEII